jgi:hypothetical protein
MNLRKAFDTRKQLIVTSGTYLYAGSLPCGLFGFNHQIYYKLANRPGNPVLSHSWFPPQQSAWIDNTTQLYAAKTYILR